VIIGIDPGKCGGAAIYHDGKISVYSFKNKTESDIVSYMDSYYTYKPKVYMEKVHSAPGQGVASMFTFGQQYGFIRGVMVSLGVPIIDVTPYEWQRSLRIPSRNGKTYTEHKKMLRQIAEKLFPIPGVNAETADALLIMQYGRIKENNMDI